MKRELKIIILIAIALQLLLCCSCSLEFHEAHKLTICASYAVPGMFSYDLTIAQPESQVVERDNYGRILYEFTTINHFSGKPETSLVICQGYDSKYVYYYEDVCYLLNGYTEEDIVPFKGKNDWNTSIQREKSSRREIDLSLDMCINHGADLSINKICSVVCRDLGISDDQILNRCIDDVNSHGQEMYVLHTEAEGVTEIYYIMVDEAYNISYLPMPADGWTSEMIANFKQECGWEYD